MKQFAQMFIILMGVILLVVFGLGLFDDDHAPDPTSTEEWEKYQETRGTTWLFVTPITFLPWVMLVLLAIGTLFYLFKKTKRWM